jgi:hypothetical protein
MNHKITFHFGITVTWLDSSHDLCDSGCKVPITILVKSSDVVLELRFAATEFVIPVAAFFGLDSKFIADPHEDAFLSELIEQGADLRSKLAVIGGEIVDHQIRNVFPRCAHAGIGAGFARQLADKKHEAADTLTEPILTRTRTPESDDPFVDLGGRAPVVTISGASAS